MKINSFPLKLLFILCMYMFVCMHVWVYLCCSQNSPQKPFPSTMWKSLLPPCRSWRSSLGCQAHTTVSESSCWLRHSPFLLVKREIISRARHFFVTVSEIDTFLGFFATLLEIILCFQQSNVHRNNLGLGMLLHGMMLV